MELPAQMLYDLRILTNFLSSRELHQLFRGLFGKAIVQGYMIFETDHMGELDFGNLALAALNKPLKDTLVPIAQYWVSDFSAEPDRVVALNFIREHYGTNENPITEEMVELLLSWPMWVSLPELSAMLGLPYHTGYMTWFNTGSAAA